MMNRGEVILQRGWTSIGVLLGGGVNKNGSLPHDPETRVKLAYHLLKEGYIEKLVLCGKSASANFKESEAAVYRKYLVEKGIKVHRLILEEDSKDTIGNAIYSKKIFLEKNLPKNVILITSDYHLERSLIIFNHVFGKDYFFVGVGSKPFILHKLWRKMHELGYRWIDELLLAEVKSGDHLRAEEFVRKYLPRYQY